MRMRANPRWIVAIAALLLGLLAVLMLERARGAVTLSHSSVNGTAITYYAATNTQDRVVLVSHGFAGSRQMMEALSLTLARAGFPVIAFDYLGHGRTERAMSPDVTRITGTTEGLVQQTLAMAKTARQMTGKESIALVGHSMATDVIIRAAARLETAGDVVAISMYSEAVTAGHPERLLIVSGEWENRLRDVARQAVGQIGQPLEGQTARAGGIERRAVAAPYVGHVGVLWSPTTLREAAQWLGAKAAPVETGSYIGVLLLAIAAGFWPLSSLLGPRRPATRAPGRAVLIAAFLPAPLAFGASLLAGPALGLLGFGALAAFFTIWGAVTLAVLRPRFAIDQRGIAALGLVLLWGLGVFALAMDRYAAAFVPAGPRLGVALLLLPATLLFCLGDRALVAGRPTWQRAMLRLPVFVALGSALATRPEELGVMFTVLPVLMLYLVVYGSMTRWASNRAGQTGPAVAAGVILAWAIAASTPLFSSV